MEKFDDLDMWSESMGVPVRMSGYMAVEEWQSLGLTSSNVD